MPQVSRTGAQLNCEEDACFLPPLTIPPKSKPIAQTHVEIDQQIEGADRGLSDFVRSTIVGDLDLSRSKPASALSDRVRSPSLTDGGRSDARHPGRWKPTSASQQSPLKASK